ncbi:MAG TPA: phosphomannomutase [Rhizobiaceae bacterium]|nr:phosphomannomutase [Rhizobiaceae bacterium]
MDVKFGTSGLRGLAVDLCAGAAFRHVHGFCRMLAQTGKAAPGSAIFFAHDKRQSSQLLAAQTAQAVRQAGFVAQDCGEVPTPALAFHAFRQGAAAIMITGSHIPADRNGLKFYLPGAEIGKSDEAGIIEGAGAAPGLPETTPALGANSAEDVMAQWRERYRDLLPAGHFSGMRIGVHEHSSVATDFLGDLLAGFGATIHRFGKTAQFTPVDTEAVAPKFLSHYAEVAAANRLDAIISADADGDRPLLAAANGQPVPGDLIGWLAAQWADADAVATPVTSNSAIVDGAGVTVHRTRVGSPYVIAAMEDAIAEGAKCVAGFEANGGFLLASDTLINGRPVAALPTRDSTLPILAALDAMRVRGLRAGELAQASGFRATAGNRISDYPAERSAALMAALDNESQAGRLLAPIGVTENVDRTDGLRFFLKGGEVLHFRPSGNAPEMRCYAEASNENRVNELLGQGLDFIVRFGK